MVDFLTDNLALIMTSLLTIVMAAVVYFARQNSQTVSGTIKLETVQGNVSEIKDEMKGGFDDLKEFIELKERENREEFRRVSSRLESLEREGYNLRWRLEQLEHKNGGTRAPI